MKDFIYTAPAIFLSSALGQGVRFGACTNKNDLATVMIYLENITWEYRHEYYDYLLEKLSLYFDNWFFIESEQQPLFTPQELALSSITGERFAEINLMYMGDEELAQDIVKKVLLSYKNRLIVKNHINLFLKHLKTLPTLTHPLAAQHLKSVRKFKKIFDKPNHKDYPKETLLSFKDAQLVRLIKRAPWNMAQWHLNCLKSIPPISSQELKALGVKGKKEKSYFMPLSSIKGNHFQYTSYATPTTAQLIRSTELELLLQIDDIYTDSNQKRMYKKNIYFFLEYENLTPKRLHPALWGLKNNEYVTDLCSFINTSLLKQSIQNTISLPSCTTSKVLKI